MKKILKNFWHNQWVSHDNVSPIYKYDPVKKIFYLNTPAGLIKWRARRAPIDKFRNEFVNEIERLAQMKRQGRDIVSDSFKVYRKVRENYRVSYSANIRTRLKGMSEWILSALESKTS